MSGLRRLELLGVVVLGVLSASQARAVNLDPVGAGAVQSSRMLLTPMPDALVDGIWGGATLHAASAPVTCETNFRRSTPVRGLLTGSATVGATVAPKFQLMFTAPLAGVNLDSTPQTPVCPDVEELRGWHYGINDPILSAAYILIPTKRYAFSLGVRASWKIPVMGVLQKIVPSFVEAEKFLGDEWGTATLSINPGFQLEALTVAANFGVELRASSNILGRQHGSSLAGSVGFALHTIYPGLFFVADISSRLFANIGTLPLLSSSGSSLPTEVLLGMRFRLLGFSIAFGAGTGLIKGPGVSDFRIMTTLQYENYGQPPTGPPLFNILDLLTPSEIIEVDAEPRRRVRRKKKKRVPPCPDVSSMTEEQLLFVDEDCRPSKDDMPDPYADQSFDEVMCAETVAAVCGGAAKLPPIVDRVAHLEFDLGSSVLGPAQIQRLKRIASFSLPGRKLHSVVIIGHADALGSEDANKVLALARANAVSSSLHAAGIPVAKIQVSTLGESDPLVELFDEVQGARSNRRVEITIRYDVIEEPAPPTTSAPVVEETKVVVPPTEPPPPARLPITPDDGDDDDLPAVFRTDSEFDADEFGAEEIDDDDD